MAPRPLTLNGKIDRAAVMDEARRQYAQAERLGLDWSWSKAVSFSWHKARGKRDLAIWKTVEAEARRLHLQKNAS
jgi:hypothetical protein